MNRLLRLTAGGALAGAVLSPPALATPHGGIEPRPPAVGCSDESWLAGTTAICEGVVVHRDYVYDDYGADDGSSASRTGISTLPAGDKRYPVDHNSADLVALRLAIAGDLLEITFELNTLLHEDSTIAAVALDTDADVTTGGGRWAVGTHDLRVASAGWDELHVFGSGDPASQVSVDANTIVGTIPVPSRLRDAGGSFRVQAAVAQAGGTVMNVAFRGANESGVWFENAQAAALRTGDISAFGETFAVADLTGAVTRAAPAATPGLHERVYRSNHVIHPSVAGKPDGEGMTYSNDVPTRRQFYGFYHYFGRYQPYSIYIPPTPGPHPAVVFMHGAGGNHTGTVSQRGFQRDMGDRHGRIIIGTLGRGPQSYYVDKGERDVLDVIADATRHLDIDEDRIYATGYSMGGYAALRLAALHPHLFAGYVTWSGFSGDITNPVPAQYLPTNGAASGVASTASGGVGNVTELLRNLRWVDGASLYAGADYLVTANQQLAVELEQRRLGYPYIWYFHPAGEHLTFGLLDWWQKESDHIASLVRVDDPARVTFRTDGFLDDPDGAVVHDRAYWVSAIRPRRAGTMTAPAWTDIDLTSDGCGQPAPTTAPVNGAGPSPVPWVSDGVAVTGATATEAVSRLSGSLTNASSVTVDVAATCLAGTAVRYSITTDGPVTVALSDGRTIALPGAGTHQGEV